MEEFLNPYEPIDQHGGKLPHWQQGASMQFVTFRLGDAMPQEKLAQWREDREIWKTHHPEPWSPEEELRYHRTFTRRLEEWLDEGSGSCLMGDRAIRKVVEETLMQAPETRAVHHAWVVMPNHVHLLVTPRDRIETLVKIWKGVSSRKIGRGSIWQKGYRDTLIRDAGHFDNAVRYIRRNPQNLRQGTFSLWQSERALAVE